MTTAVIWRCFFSLLLYTLWSIRRCIITRLKKNKLSNKITIVVTKNYKHKYGHNTKSATRRNRSLLRPPISAFPMFNKYKSEFFKHVHCSGSARIIIVLYSNASIQIVIFGKTVLHFSFRKIIFIDFG